MSNDLIMQNILAGNPHKELYERFAAEYDITVTDVLLIRDLSEYAETDRQELHILLLLLCNAVNNGSLCLNLGSSKVKSQLALYGVDTKLLLQFLQKDCGAIAGNAAESSKPLIISGSLIYFQKYYHAEKELSRDFKKTLSLDLDQVDFTSVLEEVLTTLPFKLHPLQVQGTVCALLNNFSIISGGPGTGKTSVVVAILRCLARLGEKGFLSGVKLAAPTGRAARRMTESVHDSIKLLEKTDQVDEQILELEASTIHSLLKIYPGKKRIVGKLNLNVLIVDEVSMVDALLMSQLMNSIPSDCRVIFLGDRHQLPSVDAGAVLTDLIPLEEGDFTEAFKERLLSVIPSDWKDLDEMVQTTDTPCLLTNRITHLQHSYRSEESILKFSYAVNDFEKEKLLELMSKEDLYITKGNGVDQDFKDLPLFERKSSAANERWQWPAADYSEGIVKFERGGVHFHWSKELSEDFLPSWFEQVFNSQYADSQPYLEILKECRSLDFRDFNDKDTCETLKKLFDLVSSSRILCLTRQGRSGVDAINHAACKWLQKKLGNFNEGVFFHGSQIMITRNDYSRNLYNGDTGIIFSAGDSNIAIFESQGGFASFAAESLHHIDSAFAVTVHKSQGSEYDRVLLMLPESIENRVLSREVLYTGITRAKYLSVICGTQEIFLEAASRKVERVSGLSLWQDS